MFFTLRKQAVFSLFSFFAWFEEGGWNVEEVIFFSFQDVRWEVRPVALGNTGGDVRSARLGNSKHHASAATGSGL